MSASSGRRKKRSRSGSPTLVDCNEAVRDALEERIRRLEISIDDADRTAAVLTQERDLAVQQKQQIEQNTENIRVELRRNHELGLDITLRYTDIIYRVQNIDPDWPIPRRPGRNAQDPTNAEMLRFLGIP